ncbi:hypothetical protein SAMN05216334_12721 [Nitrosomonas ureae]|uniref:Uncharacterized protein n=1 Tax=Nitrosomonas ureae TaxID=44577 RepID=A0A1H5XH79_9PROT|nr:hypothetical protein SAMN05216334_12721 [Nitrosomonas ureae]
MKKERFTESQMQNELLKEALGKKWQSPYSAR